MEGTLQVDECSSMEEANTLFAAHTGLLALKIINPSSSSFCCNPSFGFSIPSGCYALVVTRSGQDLDFLDDQGNQSAVWPSGLHFPYSPMTRVSYLVTKQSIVVHVPINECETADHVMVNVDTTLTLRIMGDTELGEDSYAVRKFAQTLNPRDLEEAIYKSLKEAMQALTACMKSDEIYGIRRIRANERKLMIQSASTASDNNATMEEVEDSYDFYVSSSDEESEVEETSSMIDTRRRPSQTSLVQRHTSTEMIRKRLNRELKFNNIQIQSVAIRNVILPESIESQMKDDILRQNKTYEQRLQDIDSNQNTMEEEETTSMMQIFQEEQTRESQRGLEMMNLERLKLDNDVAYAAKSVKVIQEESKIKIENFRAEKSYGIQRVKDAMAKQTAESESKAQSLCANERATTKYDKDSRIAEAEAVSENTKAATDKIYSKAEGVISKISEKKREYEIQQKQTKIFEKLSENEDLILGGTGDVDDIDRMIVTDALIHRKNEKSKDVDDQISPTSVSAQIAMLRTLSDSTKSLGESTKSLEETSKKKVEDT